MTAFLEPTEGALGRILTAEHGFAVYRVEAIVDTFHRGRCMLARFIAADGPQARKMHILPVAHYVAAPAAHGAGAQTPGCEPPKAAAPGAYVPVTRKVRLISETGQAAR